MVNRFHHWVLSFTFILISFQNEVSLDAARTHTDANARILFSWKIENNQCGCATDFIRHCRRAFRQPNDQNRFEIRTKRIRATLLCNVLKCSRISKKILIRLQVWLWLYRLRVVRMFCCITCTRKLGLLYHFFFILLFSIATKYHFHWIALIIESFSCIWKPHRDQWIHQVKIDL